MGNSDEIDPSIAALLAETEDSLPGKSSNSINSNSEVSFDDIPVEENTKSKKDEYELQLERQRSAMAVPKVAKENQEIPEVDLSIKGFKEIEKYFEDKPNPVFDDPNYYKICLTGEGPASQRVHQILVKYLKCTDKADRTVYRQQIVSAYWEYLRVLAPKMVNSNLPLPKRFAMRYGVLLPSLFTPEQKDFFSRAIIKNNVNEPVLYMDEWLKGIATGKLTLSVTDEVSPSKAQAKTPAGEAARIQQLKSKNSGKLQNAENLVSQKEHERESIENQIVDRINDLTDHPVIMGLEPHKNIYSDLQRKLFAEITQRFHQLQKIDRELGNYLKEFREAKSIEESLDSKAGGLPAEEVNVDKEMILTEMNSIRQMAKMTCGRQGNQFPIFTREFFHCLDKTTGFRENVIRELKWIESIDPEAFCRVHRNVQNRIVPYVLLVPTYGDSGFCWEPFDRFNRITSRGRICIPMYPRDLKTACLTAVADLRWQVAKEKASFDWMTDGLTGHYYQYIDGKKMKGDVKQFFIDDYILWMTKESNGTQKLEKEVRAIFWRYIPFPQELKNSLRNRSLIYQELYQRDINRSMSDGY